MCSAWRFCLVEYEDLSPRGMPFSRSSGFANRARLGVPHQLGVNGRAPSARDSVEDHEKTVAPFEQQAERGRNEGIEAFAAKALPALRTHLEHSKGLASGGK